MRITAEEYRSMVASGDIDNPEKVEEMHRNRVSNDRGRIFEHLLMKGCQYYALKGIAIINKVYEPYRVIKLQGGGKFTGQFTGRAEPDFKGVLKGGQAIAFEAKSTSKSKIAQNVLTAEQQNWLQEQWAMGADAYVCVNIGQKFFTVPWTTWRDMQEEYGKKSVTAADIAKYEVIYDGAVRFLERLEEE